MATIVRIDDEVISTEEFIRTLKLTGQFEGLLDQLVRDKVAALSARQQEIAVTQEEVQERADQYRRVRGLHRAADMNRYLDAINVSLDEFEKFITDSLYQDKALAAVCSDRAVEDYFKLNSPRFDAMEIGHIVVDTEGKARELMAYLADDPDGFAEMAAEHSMADSRERGGTIGRVLRGSLRGDIEAKVFNAAPGDLLGPFPSADRGSHEIFKVCARHPARLDEDTATEIRRLLREQWLLARAQEHVIEVQ